MVNRIVLVGRLTRDPEFSYTPSGVAVAKFGIAVDRYSKNEAGERETDFINIVTWRRSAEFMRDYVRKGRLVAVDGRLQIRQYTAQDGSRRSMTEVIAENVETLERARDGEGGTGEPRGDYSRPSETPAAPAAPITPTASDDHDPFADE